MKSFAEYLGPVGVAAFAGLLAGLVGFLQALMFLALQRVGEPAQFVEEEIDPKLVSKLLGLETPLTLAGLLLPFVTVFGLEAAVQASLAQPGAWVLVQGASVLWSHVLAGVFLGLVAANWIVLRRYGSRALLLSRELEAEKAGALGRIVHTQSHWAFAALFVLPLLLAVNEYTIVGPTSIEIYAGFPTARQDLPHAQIRRVAWVRTTRLNGKLNSPVLYVCYQDGTVLTSRNPLEDPLNDLVCSDETLTEVLGHLRTASGVEVEEVTLPFETELRGVTDLDDYGFQPEP